MGTSNIFFPYRRSYLQLASLRRGSDDLIGTIIMESPRKRRHSSDKSAASSSVQTETEVPSTQKKPREHLKKICSKKNVVADVPLAAVCDVINNSEDQIPKDTLTERSALKEVKTSTEINTSAEVSTPREIQIQSEADIPVEIDALKDSSSEINNPKEINTQTGIDSPGETSAEYTCSICLDSSLLNKMKQLPCSHEFHEVCIDSWLSKSISCPICRKVIIGPNSVLHPASRIIYIQNGNSHNMDQLRRRAQELRLLAEQLRRDAEELRQHTRQLRLQTQQYLQQHVCRYER